jgi:SnoaL-like domain
VSEVEVPQPLFAPSMDAVQSLLEAVMSLNRERVRACYHEAISYSSPLFPDLRREMVMDAWDLILDGMETLSIEHEFNFADERKAQISWRCTYQRGSRKVVVPGLSTLSLWDDKIVRQVDEWAFPSWSRRQLGIKVWPFAWSKRFQRHCQDTAVAALHSRTTGYR